MTDIAFAGVDQKRLAVASQWQLMWWAFRRHRLAMAGLIITIFLYIIAIAPGFFAINDPNQQNGRAAYHPPQALHIIDTNPDGSWSFGLYFRPYQLRRDPQTLAAIYTEDPNRKIPIRLFGEGYQYDLFGSSRHASISSPRRSRASRCSCSARTGSAAASSAASCRARRSRSPSALSASSSR